MNRLKLLSRNGHLNSISAVLRIMSICAALHVAPAGSTIDKHTSMFDCHLCDGFVYCASSFTAAFEDIRCDQISMMKSMVNRSDGRDTGAVLEKCAFPLQDVEGVSGYWIQKSTQMPVGHLLYNVSNHYVDELHNGGRYPYICEDDVGRSWKEVDGRIYRRTNLRHRLCQAEKVCRNYGGKLCSILDTNMTALVLELRMANLGMWVNGTGQTCNRSTSKSLRVNGSGMFSYEESPTTLQLYGLCEKRFVVNRKSSSSSTVTLPKTTSTAIAPTKVVTSIPTTALLSTITPITKPSQVTTVAETKPSAISSVARTKPALVSVVAHTSPTNTSAAETEGWITANQREFYVHGNATSFSDATEACRSKMNSSMVFFTDPLKYLDIPQTLRLTPGHFWVGAVNSSHHKCLRLRIGQDNDAYLSRADCLQMAAFICSRTSNVSNVVENPAFSRLLADMKIDSSETQKSKRKLVSVKDERKSATTVGCIGVIVVISVFTLISLLDLTRLKCRCRYNDSKMKKSMSSALERRQREKICFRK